MDAKLEGILARMSDWTGAPDFAIAPLGGLTNSNYRIRAWAQDFVLRVNGENAGRLGIDRKLEMLALREAAQAGIGPEPLAFLEGGHLVTRLIEGRHWDAEEFRRPDRVRLLAETVKRIHALAPTGAIFSPFRRLESFLETARGLGLPMPKEVTACLETMREVELEEARDESDWRRFCHNDLVSVNYLYCEKEGAIRVLDWEFAGLGDLYYDLATIVYTHDSEGPIPPELEETLLSTYFGEVNEWRGRRLLGMKFVLLLFTASWGLAQEAMMRAGMVPPVPGFDYLDFARGLLERDLQELRAALS